MIIKATNLKDSEVEVVVYLKNYLFKWIEEYLRRNNINFQLYIAPTLKTICPVWILEAFKSV